MKSIRMPSWPQYQQWEVERRERFYLQWCAAQGIEPESEGSGDAFIGSMPDHDLTDQTERESLLEWDAD
jgi:hypothetical protein